MPETSVNNTFTLLPFGKQPRFIPGVIARGLDVSPMRNVISLLLAGIRNRCVIKELVVIYFLVRMTFGRSVWE
jgi:hypothetical protein